MTNSTVNDGGMTGVKHAQSVMACQTATHPQTQSAPRTSFIIFSISYLHKHITEERLKNVRKLCCYWLVVLVTCPGDIGRSSALTSADRESGGPVGSTRGEMSARFWSCRKRVTPGDGARWLSGRLV